MNLYSNQSSNPKWNAQRNLCGRTHYVDDDTLRFHKSRVISARAICDGLLFAIITSDSLDPDNRTRGFRYVLFDTFGNVLDRPKLDGAFRRSGQAEKAMWTVVNGLDPVAVTRSAMERSAKDHANGLK